MKFGTSPLMIFDLDGVLLDSKRVHYDALNDALRIENPKFVITPEEHLSIYDGLSTKKKLELLNQLKDLPIDAFESIWNMKQVITERLLSEVKPDLELISHLNFLKKSGALIALASNSIKPTVDTVLDHL